MGTRGQCCIHGSQNKDPRDCNQQRQNENVLVTKLCLKNNATSEVIRHRTRHKQTAKPSFGKSCSFSPVYVVFDLLRFPFPFSLCLIPPHSLSPCFCMESSPISSRSRPLPLPLLVQLSLAFSLLRTNPIPHTTRRTPASPTTATIATTSTTPITSLHSCYFYESHYPNYPYYPYYPY